MDAVRAAIRGRGSVLVAFSGGVDSALVLCVAREQLGSRAVALTAVSASMPVSEKEQARSLATRIGVRHLEVDSKEVADPRYASNPQNRCYFCKTELYGLCQRAASDLGLAAIIDGFNADDIKDYRPGHRAAQEHGVYSPLAAAGLTKSDVREWSRQLGLSTWDKPQTPCLSSRIPYGIAVTPERLAQIEGAEADLRILGFRAFRVRYHGDVARLEISAEEYERFNASAVRDEVSAALKARGFAYVALDLEPFRSGRLNEKVSVLRSVPASSAVVD